VLRGNGIGEQRASYIFNGASGLYDLDLGYFDEQDGISRMAIFIDGVAVDAFLLDQLLGSDNAVGATRTARSIDSVFLTTGATIEIRAVGGGSERLETDYLDIFAASGGASPAAPQNTLPLESTTLVGTPLAFVGGDAVSVSDADGGRLTTTLRVANGSLSLGASAAVAYVTDGGATTTLSGTQAEVNAALAGLTFTPSQGFVGATTVTIATTDGAGTDTDVINISVNESGDPDAEISAISRDAGFFEDRLHFNYIDLPDINSSITRTFKSTATLLVSNTGSSPLQISGFEIDGPFRLSNPAQLSNVTLQPGVEIAVQVEFDRASHTPTINNRNGVFTGELRILSNDLDTQVKTIDLAGHWQDRDEGGWEANVNEIFEVFGFGNRIANLPFVDSTSSPFNTGGLFAALDQNEVLSPYWRIADGFDSATITQIARYSGPGGETVSIHRPFTRTTTALNMTNLASDSQTILPRPASGTSSSVGTGGVIDPLFNSITFTRATVPDSWQGDDIFGVVARGASTDPSLNFGETPAVPDPTEVYGHFMRIFRALDKNGNVIPNVYLGLQDLQGLNYDFNDHVILLVGVQPVSRAPVHTLPTSVSVVEDGSTGFTGANAIRVADPDGVALTNRMTSFLQVENGALSVAPGTGLTITGNGTGFVTIVAVTGTGTGNDAQSRLNAALATLVYTPDANFSGSDTLRIVTNDRALADRDTVAITVTGVNDAPTAADVATSTERDTPLLVTLPVADVDNTLAQLVVNAPATTAQGGQIVYNGDGTATYTPAAGFSGADSFNYFVTDPGGLSSLVRTVTIDVTRSEFRVEAEDFVRVSGFTVAARAIASGGGIIEVLSGSSGVARHSFAGAAGVYDLGIGYYDEDDGVARMEVWVNGVEVADWLWNQNLGSPGVALQTLTERAIDDVTLRPGDVIELRGFRASGEPSRTDYVDFTYDRAIPDTPPPPPPFRVEAEAFQLAQSFGVVSRSISSGGAFIEATGGSPQIARHTFAGVAGVYDLDLGYYDENDGVARMEVWVDGVEVADWLWNQNLGSDGVSAQTLTERAITGVALEAGDVIELRGFRAGGFEKVRTDYLDFTYVDDLPA
jgi:hypothetical protein